MSLFIPDETNNTSIVSEVGENYTVTPSHTDTHAGKKADLAGPVSAITPTSKESCPSITTRC